ncbi:MAG: methionyl-tRNA formyltransferase [Porticoccaceae bacterium]|jgi:methionyl-tRNA formyltransferase|nr:methionyl-tRNA formyltransferase [Porticoccaceae bacterium]MEA3299166.1 methionyl-tRNA formyltransferase [Pseudomonadota bacterium]
MAPSTPAARDLRVVFGGTPDFAAHHLDALIAAGCQLVGVFTQPDRPAGRGKKLTPSPVKELAQGHGLPVFQPASLKDPDAQRLLTDLAPDLFVVVAYGLLLPRAVLDIPRHGCINVHASLLPRWRGAAPIQRAIEAGDSLTGITIMGMDVGLDTGDMLRKVSCPIAADDTGGSLHDKLAALGPPALLATIADIARGETHPEKQDDSLATYAAKISKQEAEIDWRGDAIVIDRRIRAFNPFPVAYTLLAGEPLRIWRAAPVTTDHSAAPGTLLAVNDDSVTLACGHGALRLLEVQLPGKKRMPMAELLRGNPRLFAQGQRLGPNAP